VLTSAVSLLYTFIIPAMIYEFLGVGRVGMKAAKLDGWQE